MVGKDLLGEFVTEGTSPSSSTDGRTSNLCFMQLCECFCVMNGVCLGSDVMSGALQAV